MFINYFRIFSVGKKEQTEFESKTGKKVICYYANWSPYRKGEAHFEPSLIPDLCTHYIYAYAKVNDFYDILPKDLFQDVVSEGYYEFTTLKQRIPNIRTMIGVGGLEYTDRRLWFTLFNTPELRKKFIDNAIYFLRKNNFDGIDLDLQFIHRGEKFGELYDPENYAIFIREMWEALEKESAETNHDRLLLSIVVPSYGTYPYALSKINDFVDWITVIGYNYGAPVETYHVSPLYAENDWNVNASIHNHVLEGAAFNKIIMGLPVFANTYTLLKEDENGIRFRATGKGEPGPFVGLPGFFSRKEICYNLQNGWKMERPEMEVYGKKIQIGPIAYKGNQWMSFDDEVSIIPKVQYIQEYKLAGVSFWSVDLGDFDGKFCGKTMPLLKTVVNNLLSKHN